MTFEEREKKIFFDVISELTGHTSNVGNIEIGLTKAHIIKRAGERITPKRAEALFNEFSRDQYLEKQSDENTYRISASGRTLYFNHLKAEEDKTNAEKDLNTSNLKTQRLSRKNIWIGITIAVATVFFTAGNWWINKKREHREENKEYQEQIRQLQLSQSNRQRDTIIHQISISLPDSSRMEIKILK